MPRRTSASGAKRPLLSTLAVIYAVTWKNKKQEQRVCFRRVDLIELSVEPANVLLPVRLEAPRLQKSFQERARRSERRFQTQPLGG
jgi:hypothetical protein